MDIIPVAELLSEDAAHLNLKLLFGRKQVEERHINSHRIQKPGLALAGYTDHIHPGRVQILGNTEISYLWKLKPKERSKSLAELCKVDLSCFIVTKNLHIPGEVLDSVKKCGIPLLKTDMLSSRFIEEISAFLEDKLAPETVIHGVLLDIYGVGVLVVGRSGVGKSECAIELIKRGHRLVADDAVIVTRKQDYLVGTSSDLLRYHMELRGLGILNIKDMFGISAIRQRKKVELVINFVDWNPDESYDRLGMDAETRTILDIPIPLTTLPVSPGRNMAVIVEVAARNQLLKIMGYDSARAFSDKLMEKLDSQRANRDLGKLMRKKGVE